MKILAILALLVIFFHALMQKELLGELKRRFKNISLRRQMLIALFGLSSLLIIPYVIHQYSIQEQLMNLRVKEISRRVETSIQFAFKSTLENNEATLRGVSQNKEILNAFANGNKWSLQQLVLPFYSKLQEDGSVRFQFYSSNLVTVFYAGEPEKVEQDISLIQTSVAIANTEKKIVKGLEETKNGYKFTIVVPVKYFGQDIGLIEYSSDFGKAFLKKLKEDYHEDYTIYLFDSSKNTLQNKSDKNLLASTLEEDLDADPDIHLLKKVKKGETVNYYSANKNSLITLVPFQDYTGVSQGYIKAVSSLKEVIIFKEEANRITILIALLGMGLALVLSFGMANSLSRPIHQLKEISSEISGGKLNLNVYDYSPELKTENETGKLAESFQNMLISIRSINMRLKKYASELEDKVKARTGELQDTLETVQTLKSYQDGDYFLTSLITNPLCRNDNTSSVIKTEFFIKQKKNFEFRNKASEIGGDICITGNIEFHGKQYTMFINGDAMGKSMQGAGGAIVMGTVMNSIMSRSTSNRRRHDGPKEWLKQTYLELNNVFLAFDGSMLISCVVGLVSTDGKLYYFNAEHAFVILYRDNKSIFLDDSNAFLFKLGSPVEQEFALNEVQLEPGDVLLVGSDGKDDLNISENREIGDRILNEDEKLFLKTVSNSEGDLNRIYSNLLATGDLTDDLSLLRVEYIGSEEVIQSVQLIGDRLKPVLKYIQHFQFEKALQLLSEIDGEHYQILYYTGLCLERLGQGKEAIDYLERALSLNKNHASSLWLLGYINYRAGYYDSAVNLLEKSYKSNPYNTKIKGLLKKAISKKENQHETLSYEKVS